MATPIAPISANLASANLASANLVWRRAYVIKVIDGDTTILMDLETRKGLKVRHIGYNSPETHHPERGVECYGPEASETLTNMIEKKVVEYAFDPVSDKVDKYKRSLLHLRFNGEMISQYMIRHGFAFAYHRFENSYRAEQIAAESAARAAKVGLWSACQVFPDPRYPDTGDMLTQQISRPPKATASGGNVLGETGLP